MASYNHFCCVFSIVTSPLCIPSFLNTALISYFDHFEAALVLSLPLFTHCFLNNICPFMLNE